MSPHCSVVFFFSFPIHLSISRHCRALLLRDSLVNNSNSMGLLDKLWDDTVAGPRPDTGLSRLRKPSSPFSSSVVPSPNAVKDASAGAEAAPRVTRSIMIKRQAPTPTGSGTPAPAGCPSPRGSWTPPPSPAGSTPPLSPFAGGGRFRRKSLSDAYERGGGGFGPKSPTPPYDV